MCPWDKARRWLLSKLWTWLQQRGTGWSCRYCCLSLEAGWSLCQCPGADWVNTDRLSVLSSDGTRHYLCFQITGLCLFLAVIFCFLSVFVTLVLLLFEPSAGCAVVRRAGKGDGATFAYASVCSINKGAMFLRAVRVAHFPPLQTCWYLNEQREGVLRRTKGRGYQWSWCLYASQNR